MYFIKNNSCIQSLKNKTQLVTETID